MDVSKKISAYPEKFFTLIFGVHQHPQSGDVHALPGPSRRASPTVGRWWSIFGRIAASQPVRRPGK